MAWKKGESGNPDGTNVGKPFRAALKMELAADPKALRKIARALVAKAAEGDMTAAREIADRMDGKAAQSSEVTIHQTLPVEQLDDAALAARIAALEGERKADSSDTKH